MEIRQLASIPGTEHADLPPSLLDHLSNDVDRQCTAIIIETKYLQPTSNSNTPGQNSNQSKFGDLFTERLLDIKEYITQ